MPEDKSKMMFFWIRILLIVIIVVINFSLSFSLSYFFTFISSFSSLEFTFFISFNSIFVLHSSPSIVQEVSKLREKVVGLALLEHFLLAMYKASLQIKLLQ